MRTAGAVVVAGLGEGAALIALQLLGFAVIGPAVLFNPVWNSVKFITVWTQLEPAPMVFSRPVQWVGMVLAIGVIYAAAYHWLRPIFVGWTGLSRGLRFGLLLWFVSTLPPALSVAQNLLYESPAAAIVEVLTWLLIYFGVGLTVRTVYERLKSRGEA
jgi:hypothetical protein